MALAECPECKKKISTKAPICPGCGNPVTDDVRAKWKADAAGKQIMTGLIIIAVIGFGIYSWIQDVMAGPSGDVKDAVIAALPNDHPYIKSWAGDDLYGGTAVLINDEVGFWFKDGIVFATSGLARSWAPGTGYAPPSVDQATVEAAVKGDAPDTPPTLGIHYITFLQDVAGKTPQANITKSSEVSYKFDDRVLLEMKEAGGQLTSAYIGFYTRKGENKLPLDLVHASILSLHPELTSQQAGDMLNELITAAFKEPGSTFTYDHAGAKWDLTVGEKQDMNFVFKPAT